MLIQAVLILKKIHLKFGMKRRIVHRRKSYYDVDISRDSIWGNPFLIGRDGTRTEVIVKYEAWIRNRPDLLAQLPRLKNKILGCWCAPLACHGEVLLKLLKEFGIEDEIQHPTGDDTEDPSESG
jgi:hypothetical protein